MPNQVHHVVVHSHDADAFVSFLTEVVGMRVLHELHVGSSVFEATLGWPPGDGARIVMLGQGDAGLFEVLDVPEELRSTVPEGLAAVSFLSGDLDQALARAQERAQDVVRFDTGVPGLDAFLCKVGGVSIELMAQG